MSWVKRLVESKRRVANLRVVVFMASRLASMVERLIRSFLPGMG